MPLLNRGDTFPRLTIHDRQPVGPGDSVTGQKAAA